MLSASRYEHAPGGWFVVTRWGDLIERHGPYRWRWYARLLSWLDDEQH